jgi:hypothetical protein
MWKDVTVEPWDPSANAGGGGSGGSGGGAPDWCDASALVPDEFSEAARWYVCTSQLPTDPGDPCPDKDEPVVTSMASSKLAETDYGCGQVVIDIPCGPDPTSDRCCYVVETDYAICEGRPLLVDGAVVSASTVRREDWATDVDIATAELTPIERAALAAEWAASGRAEHASVASFARAALELLALGAPAELVHGAQRAMGDEILHAKLCFGIASRLGDRSVGPGRLDAGAPIAARLDPIDVAVATTVEGCINETLSALVVLTERDAATDPGVRRALERIAEDEARHAALAWKTVRWLIDAFGEPVHRAVAEAFANTPPPAAPRVARSVPTDVARAFGRLEPAEAHAVLRRGYTEIVVPCSRALLG